MLHINSWITLSVIVLVACLLLGRTMTRRYAARERARQEKQSRRTAFLMDFDLDFKRGLVVPEGAVLDAAIEKELGSAAGSQAPNPPGQPAADAAVAKEPVTPVVPAMAATAPTSAAAPSNEVLQDAPPRVLGEETAGDETTVAPPIAALGAAMPIRRNTSLQAAPGTTSGAIPEPRNVVAGKAALSAAPREAVATPVEPVARVPGASVPQARATSPQSRPRPKSQAKPEPQVRLSAPVIDTLAEASDGRRVRYAFNMGALPGIAYIGKHLEPKLAFQRMEGGGTVLRVVTEASTIELPLPPSRLLAGLRLATQGLDDGTDSMGEQSPRPAVAGSPGLSAGTMAFVHSEHSRVVDRLTDHLQRQPQDLSIRRRLGQALLAQAGITLDEMERARLLELSIEHLQQVLVEQGVDEALCTLLGQAYYDRAKIGPEVDPDWLQEAEAALRRAVSLGAPAGSDAAWLLQQSLQLIPGAAATGLVAARLQEAQAMQAQGVASGPENPVRWQVAIMRTELLVADHVQRNATARRLYLRQLHARYEGMMAIKQAPAVFEAWVAMLCAIAESAAGSSAMERYTEAEGVLGRMPSSSAEGAEHARALADLALSRVKTEQGAAPVALLVQAQEALAHFIDQDNALRLRAAHVAMARTRDVDAAVAATLYRHVAELAVPLTSVPSLAVDALRLVLGALLALGDTGDHGVYARCLAVLAGPEDTASLWLLAESAFREGLHAEGCRYAEQAWRISGQAAPRMLDLWQQASAQWLVLEGDSPEAAISLRHLRMARAKRGVAA